MHFFLKIVAPYWHFQGPNFQNFPGKDTLRPFHMPHTSALVWSAPQL